MLTIHKRELVIAYLCCQRSELSLHSFVSTDSKELPKSLRRKLRRRSRVGLGTIVVNAYRLRAPYVAPWWSSLIALRQRSAGGVLSLSLRIWSIHLQRGWPGDCFHLRLDGRQNVRSTWHRNALWTGGLELTILTLSPPIPLRLYTLPYWSNPPFLIFDIRALRTERPNVKN